MGRAGNRRHALASLIERSRKGSCVAGSVSGWVDGSAADKLAGAGGIAIWHFAVLVPGRFWGGSISAFLAALLVWDEDDR